jgi:hypothetical protein
MDLAEQPGLLRSSASLTKTHVKLEAFTVWVLNNLDILHQCPHALFEGLSNDQKQEFKASVQHLIKVMKGEVEGELQRNTKFEALRDKRMATFPFALGISSSHMC